MMLRAFTRPSFRRPRQPRRPHPDRLASLLSGERAGEVGLETLMRVL